MKDWASRQEQAFLGSYAEDYRQSSGLQEAAIDGTTALESRFSYTLGDKWHTDRLLFLIKDKYKYMIDLSYPKEDEGTDKAAWVEDTISSVRLSKDTLNGSLGFIQDEDDLMDKNKTVTYTNQTFQYRLRVPEYWTAGMEGSMDSPNKTFVFPGGMLTIEADEHTGLEDTVKQIEQSHKKNAEADADYLYTETDESMFDAGVKRFSLNYKTKGVPYTQNEYVFSKNDIVYTVRVRINDARKTGEAWERIEQAVRSLTFPAS